MSVLEENQNRDIYIYMQNYPNFTAEVADCYNWSLRVRYLKIENNSANFRIQ